LFDGGVASCEVGVCKPDPEIYRHLLAKYELDPTETLFTDDSKENAEAAFRAAITGIPFRNVKSFCKALVALGVEL
jgi:HAD superfamily hydrolase (TIGR01509 family)